MIRHRLSLFCFWLYSALLVLGGLRYVVLTRYLPHHAAAVGKSWEELGRGEQVVLLAALRGAGGAFLACGVAIVFLLCVPIRRGEAWARYAILAIGLSAGAPLSHGVLAVARETASRPPTFALFIGLLLLLVGALAGGPAVEQEKEKKG
jgi:hypothetical protein